LKNEVWDELGLRRVLGKRRRRGYGSSGDWHDLYPLEMQMPRVDVGLSLDKTVRAKTGAYGLGRQGFIKSLPVEHLVYFKKRVKGNVVNW
jgi:hypothetical protein